MTHQEMLGAVRKACIEANPSIVELSFGCEVVSRITKSTGIIMGRFSSKLYHVFVPAFGHSIALQKEDIIKIVGGPIRLADVLLAMIKNYQTPDIGLGSGSDGFCLWWFEDSNKDGSKCTPIWNLLKDNLSLQSEEAVSFLYQLVCGK